MATTLIRYTSAALVVNALLTHTDARAAAASSSATNTPVLAQTARHVGAGTFLGALAGATAARGPVSDLEQVTVTATRLRTDVDAVPATVSVISAATIEEQLAQNIKDLVRYEAGVSVRASPSRFSAALASTGRDGNSGFNIRGLEGNPMDAGDVETRLL